MANPEQPLAVVLDPVILIREIMNPEERPICDAWRDGLIKPVISKSILNHTLRLLRKLGLAAPLLEIWALWLTRNDKVIILEHAEGNGSTLSAYYQACTESEAVGLITDRPENFPAESACEGDSPHTRRADGNTTKIMSPLDLLNQVRLSHNLPNGI